MSYVYMPKRQMHQSQAELTWPMGHEIQKLNDAAVVY